jgi:hypothetical protein
LREVVQHFESDTNLHSKHAPGYVQQMATKTVEYKANCLIRSNARTKRESDS